MLILAAYFTRSYWLPASTSSPEPTRVVNLGTGDVQVTLTWNGYNDLDLYVTDPFGETIYYQHTTSASNGQLDVDANRGCVSNITPNPVENIFWLSGAAPRGTFTVYVNYYANCTGSSLQDAYALHILVDGADREFTGTVSRVGDNYSVTKFNR